MLRFWRLACVALALRRKNGKIRVKCDVWVQMLATELFSRLRGVIQLLMAAIVMACLFAAGPAMADGKRVALIIGNANYPGEGILPNPGMDADRVAQAATKAGFDVTIVKDRGLAQFKADLRAFRDKADHAEIALLYYAGHGVEKDNANYLIPVDARLIDPRDVNDEAVDLADVVGNLSGAERRVIILDACRDNPFRNKWADKSRSYRNGLGEMNLPFNSLVLYSTDVGMRASDNSSFAEALSKRMTQAGLALDRLGTEVSEDVRKSTSGQQVPYTAGKLDGNWKNIYFVAPASLPVDLSTQDETDWIQAKRLNSVESYRNYKRVHPTGKYYTAAQERLDDLLLGGSPLPGGRPLPLIPAPPAFDYGAYPNCRDTLIGAADADRPSLIASCKGSLAQFKSVVLDRFPSDMAAHLDSVRAIDRDQVQAKSEISGDDKAKFRATVQQREADAADGGKLMQSYQTARNRWDNDLRYVSSFGNSAVSKPLPLLPNAPVFSLSAFPNCRNSWQSATDQSAQVTAIGACRDAYNQYQTGVVNPFAAQIGEHNKQVRALLAGVESDLGFSDTDKAGFRDSVRKRETDTASGGMLVPDFDRARQGISADLAYLTENLNRLMPQQMGLPYRAPQVVRRYESDGFPIMPDPLVFAYGPYPTCKDNWKGVADSQGKVDATNTCKESYSAYRRDWLNLFREAMNDNGKLASSIFSNEVERFNEGKPGAYDRVMQFYGKMTERSRDVRDGGRLMADYEAAVAKWRAEYREVEDSYNRATGCGNYPRPADLAPNTNCRASDKLD